MNMNAKEMKQAVAGSEVPVVAEFWAPWCGYCRRLGPAVDRLEEESEGKIKVLKIDIDSNAELAEELQVDTIPTLFLFRGGEFVSSVVNPGSQDAIEDWLKDNQAL